MSWRRRRRVPAAMRPCSIETEARLGKPMTSPTAKMCGCLVRIVRVHRDAAALVGFEPGGGEVELVDVALAADRVEQRVAGDLLLALADWRRRCRRGVLRRFRLLR